MVYAPGFGDQPPSAYEAGGFPVPGYYGGYQPMSQAAMAFLARARGMNPGQQTALYSFLQTPQGTAWVESLTPEQVDYMTTEQLGMPYMGAGPQPSPEAPWGYGTPYVGGGLGEPAGSQYQRAQWGGYGAPQQGFMPEPTAGATYAAALPGFEPPAMEQYYRGQTSPMYQRFLGTAAEAQRKVEESLLERPTDVWGPRGQERGYLARLLEYQYPEEFKQLMAKEITPGMPASQVDWTGGTTLGPTAESSRVAWLESQPEYQELTRRAGTSAGAFESYLGQYPWLEEYQRIPARQRGEYTAKFQPSARWLTY